MKSERRVKESKDRFYNPNTVKLHFSLWLCSWRGGASRCGCLGCAIVRVTF
jgi:hypothetical protein